MKSFIGLVCILVLSSCSYSQVEGGGEFERRRADDFYTGSGVMQYFISELPSWAQVSQSGQCHQNFSVRFINASDLMESFNLDYEQTLQFQYTYNLDLKRQMRESESGSFSIRDYERLFFDVTDKIRSEIYSFNVPRFERVHLVWVDAAMNSEIERRRLVGAMNTDEMDQGHPVFISLCHQREDVTSFIQDQPFSQNIRVLSYEMLNPYRSDGSLGFIRHIEINKVLKDKDIYFYLPRGVDPPDEVKGEFNIGRL